MKKTKPEDEPLKKYMKRGDLEKIARGETKEEVQKTSESEKNESKESQPSPVETVLSTRPLLPRSEVTKRLRARNQPITFFGETDFQREERLRQLEAMDTEESSEQGRNDFKEAIKEIDDEDQEEDAKKAIAEDGTDSEDEKEIPTGEAIQLSQEDFILSSFKRIIKVWGEDLNERPDAIKRTAQGKIQTATFKQTKKYLRPLFKLLRNRSLAQDIRVSLHKIAMFLQKKDYKAAGDVYLELAIGNSPWPMGVTMVGIHERSAREKIFSNQIAHILNDETQRKYIQSVKRLMSFCQQKYPVDPSRMVG